MAAQGERVLICKRNRPIVELHAVQSARTTPRPIGLARGRVSVPPAFFDPLPPHVLGGFEGAPSRADPLEFLFLGLFFYMLLVLARKHQTDTGFLRALKVWMIVELVLFIIFLPLLYTPVKIVYTVYGLLYLVSRIAALVITVRMRATVEVV